MSLELKVSKSLNFNFNPDGIPDELKHYKQWVVWSLFEEGDKNTKIPTYLYKNQIKKAKWSQPDNWYTFEDALVLYQQHDDLHGVGFVFTENDPFIGIDFDKMIVDDERNQWIQTDTWSEFSQSGKGIHMIVKGTMNKAFKPSSGEVEIYHKGRFFAMTGALTANQCLDIKENQLLIDELIVTYSSEKELDQRLKAKDKFELPELVEEGNRDNTMYQYCCSLFAKGFKEEDVLLKALRENKARFYPPLEKEEVLAKVENAKFFIEEQQQRERQQIIKQLNSNESSDLAKRFVFVRESGRIIDVKNKIQMNVASFNQSMGDIATEVIDSKGQPKLEMVLPSNFLKEQDDYRVVDGMGWMPIPYGEELNNDYLYINNQGCSYINKWKGFALTPVRGNVKPWLRRLKSLVPCKKARKVMIRRMAIDIQRPNIKTNWQIVMYGGYGAGKDSILRPFQQIFGEAFKSMDGGSAVGDYDDELVGTKVLLVNEVENLGRDPKSNVWLKRNCSSEGARAIMLNPKKEAKVLQANVSSLYLLSNEADCIKCDEHERRYYVIETSYEEITLEEKEDYFDNWLDKNGAAALFDFLMRVDISKIDPFTLPERTEAFYTMADLSLADWENVLLRNMESESGSFAYGVVNPRVILDRDLMSIRFTPKEGVIKKWLTKKGFMKLPIQPSKTVSGKANKKSRSWLYNSKTINHVDLYSATDWWDMIDEAENADSGFLEI